MRRSTARSAADRRPALTVHDRSGGPAPCGPPAGRPFRGPAPMKPARSVTPWLFIAPRARHVRLRRAAADAAHGRLQLHGVERLRADDVRRVRQLPGRGDRPDLPRLVPPCRLYIAATLVLEVLVGLALAGSSSRATGRLWFRVAFFAPVMLPMVVVAVLWSFVYNPDFGLRQRDARRRGPGPAPAVWLGDPATALWPQSVVSGWVYAGFYMMIFYAAFRQIPHEVLEAARLDGAGEWALFRRVKVPIIRNRRSQSGAPLRHRRLSGLRPVLRADQRRPVRRDRDPDDLPREGRLPQWRCGYGSAMAVVLTLIVLGVGFVYSRMARRRPRRERRARRRGRGGAGARRATLRHRVGPGGVG